MLRRSGLSVAPRFLWECLTSQTVNWIPAPATSHVACGFPALRVPAHFTSRVMGPIGAGAAAWLATIRNAVLRKEPERAVQPFPAPPLPAKASTLARSGQVAPNPLLYPVLDVREAPTRVAYREVIHPTA